MKTLQDLQQEARTEIEFIVGLDEQRAFTDQLILRVADALQEVVVPEEKFIRTQIACPDGQIGCLVFHATSYPDVSYNDCRAKVLDAFKSFREGVIKE